MQHSHATTFGALVQGDGTVRFRFWAPGAGRVEVEVNGARSAMTGAGDGWFEAVLPARAGDRYKYSIDGGDPVPDPASRYQPDDVHGASEIVDPGAFAWPDTAWRGRPFSETVLYELHIGTFTPEGTFAAAREKLGYLRDLGVTALEIMPVAECPGERNWGYDGVYPYAPEARYGRPEDFKALVQAAHEHGLMVFLDVVYNHFGPEGNYLGAYAKGFFTEKHKTPWGAAIDFAERAVRDFYIDNALYWLEEFQLDGLRFDAVHAIKDDTRPDVLEELASTVRARLGDRPVHLVLENDDNQARYLAPGLYDAQWDDDIHHVFHVILTGEKAGYYEDYADGTMARLGRCLAEGFAYQGDPSAHRDGLPRGEPSAHLRPTAFVAFLQNHDQIGNRAFGERLSALAPSNAVRAAAAIYLLSPQIPMLFMGEEWGSTQPFPFFCDFHGELADAVREGRRREFARFPEFADPEARARIPDPQAESTMELARLHWREAPGEMLAHYRTLLALRRERIMPLLADLDGAKAEFDSGETLHVRWALPAGTLELECNLSGFAAPRRLDGDPFYATHPPLGDEMPPWSVAWYLDR